MAHILIVDDCEHTRSLIDKLISKNTNHRTTLAPSGDRALDMVVADPPDLIVTDIEMPGISGLVLMDKLEGSFKFVAMSAEPMYGGYMPEGTPFVNKSRLMGIIGVIRDALEK